MKRSQGQTRIFALPLRLWLQRFSFVILLAAAGGLLLFNHTQPQFAEQLRIRIIDFTAPLISALARPVATFDAVMADLTAYFNLRTENERLRAENARLLQWQHAAQAALTENRELRSLLHFKTEPNQAYITARVIGASGGPFTRSMIITAGTYDGVKKNMAAMSAEGLIGRVTEVGAWSSRIMLITDINSRIPVMFTDAGPGGDLTGQRGILAGDNSATPQLLYLPQDTVPQPGMRLVTSGHGGVFPPQLPVGAVAAAEHGISVTPAADFSHVNYVRLVDFGLAGGDANPMNRDIDAAKNHAKKPHGR